MVIKDNEQEKQKERMIGMGGSRGMKEGAKQKKQPV